MKKIILSLLFSGVVGLGGNIAFAQVDTDPVTTGVPAVSAGLGIGLIILWCVMMLLSILLFVFWLLMLIDCVKRDFEQKTLWIVLIVLLGWIGATAYYFAIKRKGKGNQISPSQTTPPTLGSTESTMPETNVETPAAINEPTNVSTDVPDTTYKNTEEKPSEPQAVNKDEIISQNDDATKNF